MMQILGDRVLVALPPAEEEQVTPAGIVLVKDPDRIYTPTRGIVMQLGRKSNTCDLDDVRSEVHTWFVEEKRANLERGRAGEHWGGNEAYSFAHVRVNELLRTMRPAPFDVQVGDCVIFGLGAGHAFEHEGVDYVVLRESEIIGVLQPKEEAA